MSHLKTSFRGACHESHRTRSDRPVRLCHWIVATSVAAQEQAPIHFETQIRPILKAHCWHCHGEEPELRGKLDARLVRSLVQGGESGTAIVPGHKEESLLWQRVQSGDMPPGKKKLSAEEAELLGRWIDLGALTAKPEPEQFSAEEVLREEAQQHWSFRPVVRPKSRPFSISISYRILSMLSSCRSSKLRGFHFRNEQIGKR